MSKIEGTSTNREKFFFLFSSTNYLGYAMLVYGSHNVKPILKNEPSQTNIKKSQVEETCFKLLLKNVILLTVLVLERGWYFENPFSQYYSFVPESS